VILVGLILMLYASVIKALVVQWWTDADYGDGFFVPLFSGYILWRERERWMKTEIKPSHFWICGAAWGSWPAVTWFTGG
jgi:hypothetical protein